MALPPSNVTPHGLDLQAKLEAAGPTLGDWPQPNRDDLVIIGGIVVMYSYVEFQLRRIYDAFKHGGLLLEPWQSSKDEPRVGQLEEAVQSAKAWSGPADVEALKDLAAMRPIRNLVAHFVVRRFPQDEAFVFFAKTRKDFKRVFGVEPEMDQALTAVLHRHVLIDALKRIEFLHNWLAKVAVSFEKQLLPDLQVGDMPTLRSGE